MNDCEETGIVRLEDLPENEIFVELESTFLNDLKDKIKVYYSINKFSDKIKLSNRILLHFLNKESLVRLDILNTILDYFHLKLKDIQHEIKNIRGRKGDKIIWDNFSFDFTTKEGVRFIACIFGDGCLHNDEIYYGNKNFDLINGFIEDSRKIFGDIKIKIYRQKVMIVSLPSICGKIIKCIGIKSGKKVINNPSIPKFIFNLGNDRISEFISQIIDDEGSINLKSRYLKIKFAVLSSMGVCNLSKGLQILIKKLGVDCFLYNFEKRNYNDKERTFWQIQISSIIELQKLYPFLNLRHKEKDKRFKFLFDTVKQVQYPRKKCTKIYLDIMQNFQRTKGFFTSYDISIETGRDIGSCRNTILKLKKEGFVKCIKPYNRNLNSFAKYGVLK